MDDQKNKTFEEIMGSMGNLADDLWGAASGLKKKILKNEKETTVSPNPFEDIEGLIQDLQKNIDSDMEALHSSMSDKNAKINKTIDQLNQSVNSGTAPNSLNQNVNIGTTPDSLNKNIAPENSGTMQEAADSQVQKPKEPETDPQEELDALVGLKDLKKDVKDLIALVKTQKMREDNGLKVVPVSKHLVFTGNPGTGKTTVARILARLYKQIGVLSTGHLGEVDRSGLVAGYVGQTAIQTQKKIQEAMGGILFIDEAYTLAKAGGNDFGQEAIDTVLKAMEDNRDDFVVIVAGYSELMENFINSNPGLKSRFNKYFHFPDYTADELIKIFEGQCKKYDYLLEEDAKEEVIHILKNMEAAKDANFANARNVRNLFETIITRQATRLAQLEAPEKDEMRTITKSDVTGESKVEEHSGKYKMIALDMDGTVLNSKKEIDATTETAIKKAIEAGKEVVFCTGRSYAEMEETLAKFPGINYLCGESGGLIYDVRNQKVLHSDVFRQEDIDAVVKHMEQTDYMPFMMASGKSMTNRSLLEHSVKYQVDHFKSLIENVCVLVDDLIQQQKEEGFTVEKFNLYHTSAQEREKTLERLQKLELPLEMVFSEFSSLELTPKGVDKASGLRHLSELTGIGMDEIIMVGDADNDLPALQACGLGVAMGNANDKVMKAASVVVADNEHSGVSEAIEKYLL